MFILNAHTIRRNASQQVLKAKVRKRRRQRAREKGKQPVTESTHGAHGEYMQRKYVLTSDRECKQD